MSEALGAAGARKRQRSDDENGELRPLKVLVEKQIPAAHRRHGEIRYHESGLVRLKVFEGLFPAASGEDMPALGLEDAAQPLEHRGVVIYEEDG